MKTRTVLSVVTLLLIAAFAVAWTAQAERQSTAAPRQAWEYKTLQLHVGSGASTLAEDGKELPGPVNARLKAIEFGAQGWELVSVTSWGDFLYYWFKRPR